MAVVISKRDRNLLINSEASKAIEWLRQMLIDHPEITDELLLTVPESDRQTVYNMIGRLIQEATAEWITDGFDDIPDQDLGNDRVKCSLCGNPDNKLVFYIVNIHNKNRMNVGSTCIFHFKDLKFPDGTTIDSYVQGARNKVHRLRREVALDKQFPRIANMINSWGYRLNSYPVLVPDRYSLRYTEIGKQLKMYFDSYVNGKSKKNPTEPINTLLNEYKELIDKIEEYVSIESAKTHPFVARRVIIDWLTRNGLDQALIWLRVDGEIRWRTAHRICESNFMENLLNIFNEKTEDRVLFLSFNADKKGYNISIKPLDSVSLFIKHDELVENYGGFLTNESNIIPSAKQLVVIGQVIKTEESISIIIRELLKKPLKEPIQFLDIFVEYNELYASNRATRTVHQLNLNNFLKKFKTIIVNSDAFNPQDISDEVKKGKSFNLADFEELLKVRAPLGKGEKRDMKYVFGN